MFSFNESMFELISQYMSYLAIFILWMSIPNAFSKTKKKAIEIVHSIASIGILYWLWSSGRISRVVGETSNEITNFADTNWYQLPFITMALPFVVILFILKFREMSNSDKKNQHEADLSKT